MFLVIVISTIIGTTTSIFQYSIVEAQSNDNSSFVDTPIVEPIIVTVKNFAFDHPSLSLPNGTNVIFDFQDPFHTVKTTSASMADPITINNGRGDTDDVPQGEKREVTINGSSGGMIEYECGIHGPSMSGIISIEEGNMEGGSDMLGVEAQTVVPISIGIVNPLNIAYDPENKRMYVVGAGNNTVSVIDTTTNTVVGSPITVGNSPFGIAYDPVNQRMYVTNRGDDTVSVIDTTTNTVVGKPIKVGDLPSGIAYDPVNQRIYVTNLGNNTVSVIDTTTNTVVGSPIKVGDLPSGIAYDPVNQRIYVTNLGNNTVSVIDTTTNTVVGNPIKVGDLPNDVANHPVNKRMYVGNYFVNTVSVIDTTTNTVVGNPIKVGDGPFDIAYDQVNKVRMYVTNFVMTLSL